jgi:trehalose 6-phosphate phosphatase
VDSYLDPIANSLSESLIAVDFDGTLAPMVPDPEASRPVSGSVEVLQDLARRGAQIAVVTGRDAATAVRLSGAEAIDRVVVSGLYGTQLWHDGELASAEEPPGLAVIRRVLAGRMAAIDPDLWVEDKRLSLVVHTRRTLDPLQRLRDIDAAVRELARASGLEVHPGKLVLEIRGPGTSKAHAIRTLLTDDVAAAVYAGDDAGDVSAVEALREWATASGRPALSISVGDQPDMTRAADVSVNSPEDLVELLRRLHARAVARSA